MPHMLYPPELGGAPQRDRFEPIREGARYGLSPEQALAIWKRVSDEATDRFGRRDEDRALTRFHALATHTTGPGSRRQTAPGRRTRVSTEIDGEQAGPRDALAPRVPGRRTLVDVEARRWTSSIPVLEEAPASLLPMHGARAVARSGGPSFVSRDLAAGASAHDTGDLGAVEPALVDQGNGGEPLPPALAARMRELFHHDFTHVRIHTDGAAARASATLGARAFTLGSHIYFNRDQFTLGTAWSERLLVHELMHVVQHDEGRLPHADDGLQVSDPGSATEREARATEDRASHPSSHGSAEHPVQAPALAPPIRTADAAPAHVEIQRSPEDAASASPDYVAFVREDGLNLRAAPDQKAASLRKMKFGQRVHVLEDSGQGGWLKIAVLGQTGYAAKASIHAPPKDLIAKDPGLTLIRVKQGQTFWSLVKTSYGIQGNEGTPDQNIDHFINAIRAVNKPEAFKVKAGVLDSVANAVVSGRDASNTELRAGVDLWIPSFGVAAKMDVGSGTVTGEVSRTVKKIEQKLEDFKASASASGKYIPAAVRRNAGEAAMGMLDGLIDFAADAAKILAVSTAVGALIGSLFGGVGAIPGAEIGFEIGMWILEYYGLYMIVEAVLSVGGNLIGQLGQFLALAWQADGDKAKIEQAGKALAEALGIFVSALLIVLAAYLMKRGADALGKTKFAQKVGQTRLAQWLAERQKMSTTKNALVKEKPAPPDGNPGKKPVDATDEHAKDEHAKDEHAKDEHAKDEHAKDEHAKDEGALKPNGEFEDPQLERKYQDYLKRKQAAGANARARADWKKRSDWWKNESPVARGNAFNKSVRESGLYPYNEVNLADGTRLDSYRVRGTPERISRKATDFNKVKPSEFQGYLDEFNTKYPEGKIIRSDAYPALDGTPLKGAAVLEVPSTNLGPEYAARRAEFEALARAKGIQIRYTPE
jgi:hypothetical protein